MTWRAASVTEIVFTAAGSFLFRDRTAGPIGTLFGAGLVLAARIAGVARAVVGTGTVARIAWITWFLGIARRF